MLVLTVVALRLFGLWLITMNITNLIYYALEWYGFISSDATAETILVVMAFAAIRILTGAVLIVLALPIARLVVPKQAKDLPAPSSVSSKTAVQIGVFMIGVWMLVNDVPRAVSASLMQGVTPPPDFLISGGVALLLIFGSGLFAGLIGKLRNWP